MKISFSLYRQPQTFCSCRLQIQWLVVLWCKAIWCKSSPCCWIINTANVPEWWMLQFTIKCTVEAIYFIYTKYCSSIVMNLTIKAFHLKFDDVILRMVQRVCHHRQIKQFVVLCFKGWKLYPEMKKTKVPNKVQKTSARRVTLRVMSW